MKQRRFWALALLVPMLLNVAGAAALADDPSVEGTVVIDPGPPSVDATTGTRVPSTTAPAVEITTTEPITVTTTTTVSGSTTPVAGSVNASGPGTTVAAPITTTVAPGGTIVPPATTVAVPTDPTVSGSATAPITTTGTGASLVGDTVTANGVILTSGTGASATATEPANGISANASAGAAICLLAQAVGRTTLDPTSRASLSTLCGDSASTASGGAGATAGEDATGSADLAASICLVANALALPSPISTDYLASAGLDTRCGTGPSTAAVDSTASAFDASTMNGSGAAAICLLASALGGLPTTADLSTACGTADEASPSTVTGGADGDAGTVAGAELDLAAAICIVAHAVADLPVTATLTTPCGTSPTAATPQDVLGSETSPGQSKTGPGQTEAGITAPSDGNPPTGLFGVTGLPSSATAIGAGGLALALVALGVAFLRRRQTTH